MHPISTLRQLSNIISDAVDDIERTYEASGKALPSIDQPFDQNDPAEALLKDARVSSATKNIMAAAAQLSATVCDPRRGAVNMSKSVRACRKYLCSILNDSLRSSFSRPAYAPHQNWMWLNCCARLEPR
jgi:hypothetical protein